MMKLCRYSFVFLGFCVLCVTFDMIPAKKVRGILKDKKGENKLGKYVHAKLTDKAFHEAMKYEESIGGLNTVYWGFRKQFNKQAQKLGFDINASNKFWKERVKKTANTAYTTHVMRIANRYGKRLKSGFGRIESDRKNGWDSYWGLIGRQTILSLNAMVAKEDLGNIVDNWLLPSAKREEIVKKKVDQWHALGYPVGEKIDEERPEPMPEARPPQTFQDMEALKKEFLFVWTYFPKAKTFGQLAQRKALVLNWFGESAKVRLVNKAPAVSSLQAWNSIAVPEIQKVGQKLLKNLEGQLSVVVQAYKNALKKLKVEIHLFGQKRRLAMLLKKLDMQYQKASVILDDFFLGAHIPELKFLNMWNRFFTSRTLLDGAHQEVKRLFGN